MLETLDVEYREESKIEQTDRDFEKTDCILEHHMEVLSA